MEELVWSDGESNVITGLVESPSAALYSVKYETLKTKVLLLKLKLMQIGVVVESHVAKLPDEFPSIIRRIKSIKRFRNSYLRRLYTELKYEGQL